MMLAMIASFYIFGMIQVFAHSTMLNVEQHIVTPTGPRYGICMACNNEVPIGNGTISPWGNGDASVDGISDFEGQILTENGSYMLPSGVIVLAPADVEAYLKGELILPESLPGYPTE